MPVVRFICTTHANGMFRSFPSDALEFWRTQGMIVGEVMRSECAMSFAEIAAACQEAALDAPQDHTHLPLDESYLAWVLVKLLEFGMVEVDSRESWGEPP